MEQRTTLIGPKGADIEGTFKWIEERLKRVEDKLWPHADGSGTERYDNWTQRSDGLDYPGSYGVGPNKVSATPDQKTVEPVGDLEVGDPVRVLKDDNNVDPEVYTVQALADEGRLVYVKDGHPGYMRDRVVQVKG